ncbi:MAG: response regulator [Lentisphaerae bacterium]|nr:response regulator [Lentisphaerota bacterium]
MPEHRKVLVVDDDELVRAVINKVAERHNLQPVWAKNGNEAIGLLAQNNHFSAIFLDLLMPNCPGWDVIAFIKDNEQTKNLPIVIVSGAPISENEKERLLTKATAFVDKETFSLAAFEKLLETVLT